MLFHLEFERRLLEDLPEEVESELLAVEHVIALVSLDVLQPQLQLGLDLVQRFHQSSNDYCCTETNKKACTWLREFCSCSCLSALPGIAWVLFSKIYIPFCSPLYYLHLEIGKAKYSKSYTSRHTLH